MTDVLVLYRFALWLDSRSRSSTERKIKTIDLETDYLKTDSELFEGYCRMLYLGLEVEYHQLLDLAVSAHFRWQTNTVLLRLNPWVNR